MTIHIPVFFHLLHLPIIMMRNTVLSLCVLLFISAAVASAETPAFPYEIVYTDEAGKRIVRYDTGGKIIWEHPAELSRDVERLSNGNILFCYNEYYDSKKHENVSGAVEITPDKKIVFEYKTTGQVFSCRRLPNGDTLIGAASQGKLLIVNAQGKLLKEITVKNKPGHSCMRHVCVGRNGDFLVAEESAKKVCRYRPDGKLVREIEVPFAPFSVAELPDGNVLVSGRDGIVEVTPANVVAWEFKAADFPELGIRWCAGMDILPNGNILLVNAGGRVRMFEIARTPKPTLVWQLDPNRVALPSGHGVARIAP